MPKISVKPCSAPCVSSVPSHEALHGEEFQNEFLVDGRGGGDSLATRNFQQKQLLPQARAQVEDPV